MRNTKSKLYQAMQYNDTRTENNMPAHSTSGNSVLDMFFKMGGTRSWGEEQIISLFEDAFSDDSILALKAMFYNRDVRGGQGERRSFRLMFGWLATSNPELAKRVIHLVPFYGRWDDLFAGLYTDIEQDVADFIYDALAEGNTLAKKWMPRENKKNKVIAHRLMELMNLSADEYRHLIALHGEVTENLMCENRWEDVNYNHVPSVASKKYRSAFGRHDADRYGKWLAALESGDKSVKINAGAIFPHDIVRPYLHNRSGVDRTLEAQWKALPDFVGEGVSFIPVVDTSASMHGDLAWEVAFALGVYLAERNKSVFEGAYITFSSDAKLIMLDNGSLKTKVHTFVKNAIVADTNLESVYNLILSKAKAGKVAAEDMPTHILILSDMQFNQGVEDPSFNAQEMMRAKFERAGYAVPQVVYWNLRSSEGTPVKYNETGTALVSGFSPSLMQSLLAGELTPEKMMLKVLNGERYAAVEEALQ
jgi:hypothetical protein